jgi:hypothetical protein
VLTPTLKSPNIVQYLYAGKCTGKIDFALQNVLFLQNMCRNLKLLTDVKLDLRKKFVIGPVTFAPGTSQTYAT